MPYHLRTAILIVAMTAAPLTLANTSSVFSPDVDAGDRSVEYRASFEPNDDGAEDEFSHRLHYQHALDDKRRWRLIGLQEDTGSGLEFRYMRFEYQRQFHEDENDGWDSALRFELQLAEGDNLPHRVRLAWTGKVDVSERWQLRSNVLAGREFSSGADSGVALETRWQATFKLDGGTRLGLEMYNDLNTTAGFGSFEDQGHQLGPVARFKLGRFGLDVSYLHGISSSAPDGAWRLSLRTGV